MPTCGADPLVRAYFNVASIFRWNDAYNVKPAGTDQKRVCASAAAFADAVAGLPMKVRLRPIMAAALLRCRVWNTYIRECIFVFVFVCAQEGDTVSGMRVVKVGTRTLAVAGEGCGRAPMIMCRLLADEIVIESAFDVFIGKVRMATAY